VESIIPGMIAQPVSVETGESMGDDIHWGGGQDSFYEVGLIRLKLIGSISSKHLFSGQMKKHSYIEIDGSLQLKIR
jgi:hypothetical protein